MLTGEIARGRTSCPKRVHFLHHDGPQPALCHRNTLVLSHIHRFTWRRSSLVLLTLGLDEQLEASGLGH
uniref:Uncharacterized protein n=1 Tax=Aegilops tauschii subsp. strangulata TaxID=200361 RepID=A0A453C512_AEGTS